MGGVRQEEGRGNLAWQRLRVQLGGGLLLGTAIPYLISTALWSDIIHYGIFTNSLACSVFATVAAAYVLKSLVSFPGIRINLYIFPVYLSVFAAAYVVFFIFRIDYSRPLIFTTFTIATLFSYIVYYNLKKAQTLVFDIVPFGRVDTLYNIPGVNWRKMTAPRYSRDCQAIVADFHYDLPPEWEALLAESALSGVSVVHYKKLRGSLTGQIEMEHLSENAFGTLIPNNSLIFIKTVIDIFTAAVASVALLPGFAVIALLIKFDSPGPIFFRQQRVGYRGRLFTIWKFRTMRHESAGETREEDGQSVRESAITTHSDSRVTKLGAFLRRSRFDELPQLINIVRGEMSWIGPRPEAEVLSAWYQTEIPFYRYRHIVRPGITGWAQVNQGHVAELDDVLRKLSFDFYYISNFSVWLDVLIIVKTVHTMVTGFGSR